MGSSMLTLRPFDTNKARGGRVPAFQQERRVARRRRRREAGSQPCEVTVTGEIRGSEVRTSRGIPYGRLYKSEHIWNLRRILRKCFEARLHPVDFSHRVFTG